MQLLPVSLHTTSPFYIVLQKFINTGADPQKGHACNLVHWSAPSATLRSENLRTDEGTRSQALSSKLTLHPGSWAWSILQVSLPTKSPLSEIHQGSLAKFSLISFFRLFILLSLARAGQMLIIVHADAAPPPSTTPFSWSLSLVS